MLECLIVRRSLRTRHSLRTLKNDGNSSIVTQDVVTTLLVYK